MNKQFGKILLSVHHDHHDRVVHGSGLIFC